MTHRLRWRTSLYKGCLRCTVVDKPDNISTGKVGGHGMNQEWGREEFGLADEVVRATTHRAQVTLDVLGQHKDGPFWYFFSCTYPRSACFEAGVCVHEHSGKTGCEQLYSSVRR